MPDSKLTFDADTAAYNAHVDESHRKTEKLVEPFKAMAEPLLKAVSIIGLIEAGVEGVRERWNLWREEVEKAAQENKKIGTDLAAVTGAAGLLQSYPQIKKAVQESQGPLSTEQKSQAIGNFAGAFPGLNADQAIAALGQTQKAAQVIGPENIATFAQALGLAMQSGLSQQRAGDAAVAVSQSGAHGLEAFQRAAAQFSSEYTTPQARGSADFLKYIQNAGPEVFGTRPTQQLGGQAVQRRLSSLRPNELQVSADQAPAIDEQLAKQREIQERDAQTASLRQRRYGGRAETEEDIKSLQERLRSRGEGAFVGPYGVHGDLGIEQIHQQLRENEDTAAGRPGAVRRNQALAEFAIARAVDVNGGTRYDDQNKKKADEIMIEVLRGIHRNTGDKAGSAKFRNEAQDRDKGEE